LDSIYLSGDMFRGILPPIPNLEIGYLYNFGENARTDRLTFDYVLPLPLGPDSAFFGEAHGEFTNFRKTFQRVFLGAAEAKSLSTLNERADLSLGGGYRRLFTDALLLGANGFYDASRLGGRWYGSGGIGLEMVSLLPGDDMLDLNFNYYGNLFRGRSSLFNAFRNGPSNFDFEAGWSHEMYYGGPDLRLKIRAYRFDTGSAAYGWNAGGELTSRNGAFTLRLDAGHDRISKQYYTVAGFFRTGFQPERLLRLQNPFSMPNPIFTGPSRNVRSLLGRKVRREWHSPAAVVEEKSSRCRPYFRLTVGNPMGTGAVLSDVWDRSSAVVTVRGGHPLCAPYFNATRVTIRVVGLCDRRPVRVRVRVSGQNPSGPPWSPPCVDVGLILQDGTWLWPPGQRQAVVTVPESGELTWTGTGIGWGIMGVYYLNPCHCGSPIHDGAVAGYIWLEDVDGAVEPLTVQYVTHN
jgi:hypothetical protein